MGAQLVPNFAENLTPQSELDKMHAPHETFFIKRDRGTGRPTKKDRREMDALWGEFDANMLSSASPANFTVEDEDDDDDEITLPDFSFDDED